MRKPIFCTLLLICIYLLATANASAQETYGYSEVVYDDSIGAVYGNSVTEIDYNSDYYYDAYVESYLYENGNLVDSNYAESATGTASALTAAWADPNSEYTETGYHDLYVRFSDEEKYPEGCSPCDGCNTDCYWDNWYYYDAYGFSFATTGSYGPWFDSFGQGPATYLENNQEEYLGDTSASLLTPDTAVQFVNVSVDDGTPVSFGSDFTNTPSANVSVPCGGERFKVIVKFNLPQNSGSCCAQQNSRINVFSTSKFEFAYYAVYGYSWRFFPSTSPSEANNTNPPLAVAFLRRKADNSGSSDTLRVVVGGSYQSHDSYSTPANVHMICN